jgi:hypothetical protein
MWQFGNDTGHPCIPGAVATARQALQSQRLVVGGDVDVGHHGGVDSNHGDEEKNSNAKHGAMKWAPIGVNRVGGGPRPPRRVLLPEGAASGRSTNVDT